MQCLEYIKTSFHFLLATKSISLSLSWLVDFYSAIWGNLCVLFEVLWKAIRSHTSFCIYRPEQVFLFAREFSSVKRGPFFNNYQASCFVVSKPKPFLELWIPETQWSQVRSLSSLFKITHSILSNYLLLTAFLTPPP